MHLKFYFIFDDHKEIINPLNNLTLKQYNIIHQGRYKCYTIMFYFNISII